MGKGKKGKKQDVEKKAALQAKKEAKQDKKARKRLVKQQATDGDGGDASDGVDDEDFDQVLQAYRSQDKPEVGAPTWEPIESGFPLARANATFESCVDEKKDHLYLFGGEYFDGIETIVLDDLLRFDAQKKEWKQLLTSPRPSPRCAHSLVSYKQSLYAFGGEMASAGEYHHYRDLWRFDIPKMRWTEIKARNPPSPRSGHSVIVWKSYMIVFGGFFEAAKETKWFNDVHVFNLQTETWMDLPQSRLAAKPEQRSACNMALFGADKAILHAGFSKLKSIAPGSSTEAKVHTDAWVLNMAPILQEKEPTWERWMSSSKVIGTSTPNGRSGTSSVSYKNRMLVYGGVVDAEHHNHKVESVFYNDLIALDTDRRKWFPLRVKEKVSSGGRRRKKEKSGEEEIDVQENDEQNHESDSNGSDLEEEEEENGTDDPPKGWDLDMLRANMFAFVDGSGNMVYEKIEEEKEAEEDEEEEETKEDDEDEEEKDDGESKARAEQPTTNSVDVTKRGGLMENADNSKKVVSSAVMTVNAETNMPEAVARSDPLPRINASLLIQGNTLYVLGGILEVGDREVTLDDMWSLDLKKREQWDCLWPGTMHKQVWRGAVHNDDDSYISTGKEDGSDPDDDDESSGDDGDDQVGNKQDKRAELRQEIADLNAEFGLDDENATPQPNEALSEFYSRTAEHWNSQAAEGATGDGAELSRKELKREGFKLAKDRYDELEPVLQKLAAMNLGKSSKRRGDDDEQEKKKKKDKSKKKDRR